ncbi:MAG: hypothetical protein P4L28_03865 [Paludibacteraceae bacterium]|nr:hypothetical protein [Paludibacteraceae bacterium]
MMRFVTPIFFLFFGILLHAQTSGSVLERRVTVEVSNQPVENVLTSVSKQAGLVFSYSPTAVGVHNPVSLNMTNKPVKMVLNAMFHDEVSYKAKGNYVILRKNSALNQETKKLEGYVYDKKSGAKLTEASVYDKKLGVAAITDQYGYFSLKVPANKSLTDLHISKKGYVDTLLLADADKAKDIIEVDLQNDTLATKKKPVVAWRSIMPSWLIPKQLKVHSRNLTDSVFRKVQISLMPLVSTNALLSGNTGNDVALNLTVGYAYSVRKATFAGLLNIIRTDAGVCQLAGIGNLTGGTSTGFQGAGILNYSDTVKGVQCAGVVNMASSVAPVQLAGIVNITQKSKVQLSGLLNKAQQNEMMQMAGLLNVASESPLQVAGLYNRARTKAGVQVSGLLNRSAKADIQFSSLTNRADSVGIQATGLVNTADTVGIQLSGCVNTATEASVQVSSFINKARKVKALQLGIINLSDSCSGVPVGVFSYCKSGYHKLEVSYNEMSFANLSFRTGMKFLHTIFAAGVATNNSVGLYTCGFGLGLSFGNPDKWLMDIDLSSHRFFTSRYVDYSGHQSRLYVGVDRKVFKKMSIALGVSYNVLVSDTESNHYDDYRHLAPYTLTTQTSSGGRLLQTWVGATAALRFF